MDAFVYLRVEPGRMGDVMAGLSTKQGVHRALPVVGEWDVLVHAEGPDLATIARVVLGEVHFIPGVVRTVTAPVVPPDRIGITGFGGPKPPPMIADACYVHIRAEAGAAGGIAERLVEMPDVAGVAVLGGDWDLVTCVAQPWEIASGVVLDQIHQIPGIQATSTLVAIEYEDAEEDRDRFSSWS
ncbi:MAG TPA: Lrp/AsnC family transcriptional regulator [Actinomycetota bacterium]|jgi:DNA-binding Lrp family transcriptional regulator